MIQREGGGHTSKRPLQKIAEVWSCKLIHAVVPNTEDTAPPIDRKMKQTVVGRLE